MLLCFLYCSCYWQEECLCFLIKYMRCTIGGIYTCRAGLEIGNAVACNCITGAVGSHKKATKFDRVLSLKFILFFLFYYDKM
jgi:hypothetical protein